MIIWIFNHYADTPDRQATRSFDLSHELVRRGHRVTIFASSFTHYRFREERLTRAEAWMAEDVEGVRFVWLRTFSYRQNDWRRVVNMLSYAWRALRVAASIPEAPDVVIGVTVHPLAALAAYRLARVKRCRFFYEVTDLWPETLIQFGELSPRSPIAWGLRAVERFLFRRAERTIMLWRYADRYAVELGVAPEKVVWIPHGVTLSRYAGLPPYTGEVDGTFTVMYAGGLVRSNALDVVLDSAFLLQEEGVDAVRFVFVGDGTDRQRLVDRATALQVRNVEFREAVPKQELWRFMAEADAFVLSLADLPLYRYGISLNKLCDYLACGRPVLFVGRSTYNPVEEAAAGVTVPPGDARALATAIEHLRTLPAAERRRMGENGLAFVRAHHDIARLAEQLEAVLACKPAGGRMT